MASLNTATVLSTLDDLGMLDLGKEGLGGWDPEAWEAFDIDWNDANAGPENEDYGEVPVAPSGWEQIAKRVRENVTGGPRKPPVDVPDAYAWYCQLHFYGPEWGIYIKEQAILNLGDEILRYLPAPRRFELEAIQAAQRCALSSLYLHEAFHHKAESFAIRLGTIEHQKRYVPYFEQVFNKLLNTDDHLEEGLACADMLNRLGEPSYRRWVPNDVFQASKEFLRAWILNLPSGYRRGVELASKPAYEEHLNLLSSQIHEGRVAPMRRSSEWALVPHGWRGLFNCETVTRIIVPVGERPIIPWFNKSPFELSISTKELSKALNNQGYEIDNKGGKGSHIKFRAPGRPMVILPANRESLSYRVLQTAAEALELPSVAAIKDILV